MQEFGDFAVTWTAVMWGSLSVAFVLVGGDVVILAALWGTAWQLRKGAEAPG